MAEAQPGRACVDGYPVARELDLFAPPSWLAVHVGQNNLPEGHDPLLDYRGIDARDWLARLRATMASEASRLPRHDEVLARHCPAAA